MNINKFSKADNSMYFKLLCTYQFYMFVIKLDKFLINSLFIKGTMSYSIHTRNNVFVS